MKEFLAVDDLRSPAAWQAAIAELIATFGFVFLGTGAVAVAVQIMGNGELNSSGFILVAIAHGLAITVFIAAIGRISGGHINPAVTIAAVVTRRMGLAKGVMYVGAQLVGAAAGAFFLLGVIPDAFEGNLGVHSLGTLEQTIGATSVRTTIGPGVGVVTEMALTFFLVFVVFAAAMDTRGSASLAPFAIGFIVLVDHLVGVPLTGASMNPARSFGPALAAGEWADHWVYWVGPIAGGIIAGVLYELVFVRWNKEEA